MNVRHFFFTWIFLWLLVSPGWGQPLQSLRLQEAYHLLEQRYPKLGDTTLIRQMEAAELAITKLDRLPDIRLRGDGRLQSTSTQLETDNPMLDFEINQPLVNIKAYLEADYLLLDGGYQTARQSLIQLEKAVEWENLEVQRFALRKIINQLFLRIQTLRAQEDLFGLSLANIEARSEQVAAAIKQGTVLESELTKLRVQKLDLEAQRDNLTYQIASARQTLADWLGVSLLDDVALILPDLSPSTLSKEINRPELELFQQQKAVVLAQADLIDIQLKPKLHVFAQAGVGYPNPLNILDNNVAPYGLLGAGFSWTIKDWDKTKKQKDLLALQARRIDHTAETFTFQLEKQSAAYRADMARLDQQISRQESIAVLQKQLLIQLGTQLEEGVITATDYLLQVNAELATRQKIIILLAEQQAIQLNYWDERGAF